MNRLKNALFVTSFVLSVFVLRVEFLPGQSPRVKEMEKRLDEYLSPRSLKQPSNEELLEWNQTWWGGVRSDAENNPISIGESLKIWQSIYDSELCKLVMPGFGTNLEYIAAVGEHSKNDYFELKQKLKNLEWRIEANDISYKIGEPIGIRLAVKNISDQDMEIKSIDFDYLFILKSIQLKCKLRTGYVIDIPMTRAGYLQLRNMSGGWPNWGKTCTVRPGETINMEPIDATLNSFYDLTTAGSYELTFYTRNFIGENQIGEYPKPCTIRFEVESRYYEPKLEWLVEQKIQTPPL